MGFSDTLLMTAFGAKAVSDTGSAINQAGSIKAQGIYEKSQYDINSRFARLQAEDAEARGNQNSANLKKNVKKTIGSQRAALAAQGIEVDTGSAAEVQTDTAILGAMDAMTIRNNAHREAFGYRVQASDYARRGELTLQSAKQQAKSTILTGGLKSLSDFGMAYSNMRAKKDKT